MANLFFSDRSCYFSCDRDCNSSQLLNDLGNDLSKVNDQTIAEIENSGIKNNIEGVFESLSTIEQKHGV